MDESSNFKFANWRVIMTIGASHATRTTCNVARRVLFAGCLAILASSCASVDAPQAPQSRQAQQCKDGTIALSNAAVIAIYYDKEGNRVKNESGIMAEDLNGVKDRCLTQAKDGTGQQCPPGFREVSVNGVKYCVKA